MEENANQEFLPAELLNKRENKPHPNTEYQAAIQKQKAKKSLSITALIAETVVFVVLLAGIYTENLHYRSTKQLSYVLTGKGSFQSGTYTGDLDFGYFSGDGKFQFQSGTLYEGQWQDNEMNGTGGLKIPGEGVYVETS